MFKQSAVGFGAGFILLALGFVWQGQFFLAHGAVMVAGGLVPLLTLFHLNALKEFTGASFPDKKVNNLGWGITFTTFLLAIGILVDNAWLSAIALALGFVVTVELAHIILPKIPRASLLTDDPLTKGDDQCMRQMRMAHYFLPTGFYWMALGLIPVQLPILEHIFVAGIHELLIGYGLISMYAIGHLWVPRLSGIPAIAAGAIKGELHTTMLGIAGVTLGFLTGKIAFFLIFAPFVFIGFFTFMGVLGANIMKNKSQTHRVTPEFVYVPWVFSGVFWMICGVLMGLFLNVVPDELAARFGSLRYMHVHVGLAAGMLQMLLGLTTRILSARWNMAPPKFAGFMKYSFYLFNAAFAFALWGHFRGGTTDAWLMGAAAAFVVSLFMYVQAMIQERPAASA